MLLLRLCWFLQAMGSISAFLFARTRTIQSLSHSTQLGFLRSCCCNDPKEELYKKRHTQLQLQQLLSTSAGSQLVGLFRQQALLPFILAGMHVAAFEVVFSQHNIKPKCYKGYYIRNKLSCQHQDLRDDEPWFDRVSCL
jgi:hypothetical protein